MRSFFAFTVLISAAILLSCFEKAAGPSQVGNSLLLSKKTRHNGDSTVSYWIICDYDSSRRRVKETKYDSTGLLRSWLTIQYAASGKVADSSQFDSIGTRKRSDTYEYDINSYLVKYTWTYYSPDFTDGFAMHRTVYYNDVNGNKLVDTMFSADSEYLQSYTYSYDNSGHLVEEKQWYNTTVTYRKLYAYNANGLVSRLTEYDATGVITGTRKSITDYTYDAANRLVRMSSPAEQSPWFVYEYDTNGNLSKETRFWSSGIPQWWFIYEYQ